MGGHVANGDKTVTIVDAHPLASCTQGGGARSVAMVADQTLPHDIMPVFQIYVQGTHRPDLEQFLVQPSKQSIGASTVIQFQTPAQPRLALIREEFTVKLTTRDSKGVVGREKFDFMYFQHSSSETQKQTSNGWRQPNYNFGRNSQPGGICVYCNGMYD